MMSQMSQILLLRYWQRKSSNPFVFSIDKLLVTVTKNLKIENVIYMWLITLDCHICDVIKQNESELANIDF